MEKSKEINRKHYSDICDSKKVNVSKANIFKNSARLLAKSEDTKKVSYAHRSKNNSASNKKSGIYSNDIKPLFKHNYDQCRIKRSSNIIVNAVSVEHNVTDRNLEHCRKFNGNLFKVHPTLCNFTCSVPEISHLNRVLNFQSARHDELSFPKCARHKQTTVYSEQRLFNYKNPNSNDSFTRCKFPASNCNTRYHCSKIRPCNASNVDPYFNISSNQAVSQSFANDEYNLKCGFKYSANNSLPKDCESITDLPIIVHSNFSKDSWEVKYCIDNKLRINSKQRKWNAKTWDQVAVSSNRTVDSRVFEKTDKMLFPALPTNSHNQVKLNSSHTNSMPPSEHSSADNSDLESVHSFPDGNTNCTTSFLTSVSSTIPQASYADVIRSSAGVQGLVVSDFGKTPDENLSQNMVINSLPDKVHKDENSQPGSSDWVISRLSQLDPNSSDIVQSVSLAHSNQNEQNCSASRPIVVSLEKPSFYNSSLQSNKSVMGIASNTNLISANRQGMEDENLIANYMCGLENISSDKVPLLSESMQNVYLSDIPEKKVQGTGIKTDSVYSSTSNVDSYSDVFKPAENNILNACNYSKNNNPPVVIMNSSSSLQNMSEISFGIEYDEMMKLCADSCDTSVKNISSFSLQNTVECCSEENIKSLENLESFKAHVPSETTQSAIVKSLESGDQYIRIKGRKLYWSDPDIDDGSSHHKMAEYFDSVWNEFKVDNNENKKSNGNVKYYDEL